MENVLFQFLKSDPQTVSSSQRQGVVFPLDPRRGELFASVLWLVAPLFPFKVGSVGPHHLCGHPSLPAFLCLLIEGVLCLPQAYGQPRLTPFSSGQFTSDLNSLYHLRFSLLWGLGCQERKDFSVMVRLCLNLSSASQV